MGSDVECKRFEKEQNLYWGKSIPVQSVQELVRTNSAHVPDRYIRDLEDRPVIEDQCQCSWDIPVIDFSLLCEQSERYKLHQACKDWGFFQIINHGIPEGILQNTKSAVSGFFSLPLEEKKKYAMAKDDIQGYGQVYVVSEEQKLDWDDVLVLFTLPYETRTPSYWPTTVPGFKDAIDSYSMEVNRLTENLLANISLAMNMSKDALVRLHGEMKQAIRFNYYPKCCRPDLVLGVAPHSDSSSLTILLQDDKIPGLQIQHQGTWLPVKPIPNALVVNIGDVIEAWSNGMYKSIMHRAVTNKKMTRTSIATFVLPSEEIEIGPIQELLDSEGRPRLYRNVKYMDYIRHTFSRNLDGKSHTQFLKLVDEQHK